MLRVCLSFGYLSVDCRLCIIRIIRAKLIQGRNVAKPVDEVLFKHILINMKRSVKNRQIADMFKVLSVESRVQIVRLLAERGTLCVGALAKDLEISSGAVSQHLRVMRDNGIVDDQRYGYYIHYKLTPDLQQRLTAFVHDLFEEAESKQASGYCQTANRRSCHPTDES